MIRLFLFASYVLLTLVSFSVKAQIINEPRRIVWTPGIPGGIPENKGAEKNVLDFGADPTGVNDSYAAFNKALAAITSAGGVVFIPEGIYKISSTITIGKSNVVFRGEGVDKTRILMNFNGDCFSILTYGRGEWQNLSSDIAKDTDQLTVPSSSIFKVGEFAELQQANDPLIMYTKTDWNQMWADNSVGQLFEIDSISGSTLHFKTSTHLNYQARLGLKIRPQKFITNVGFEKFYVEKRQTGGYTFKFLNAAYCWIRDIESNHTRKSHVSFATSIGCVVRDSYFHHSFDYDGGGAGYGVDCEVHATDNLIENNIFNFLRHAMMVHLGANGNVFGYNYSINAVQGVGETNLNVGWTPPDISIHGHYPFMNLFEGNDVMEVGIGDYWGPAGPGNTFFRNRVRGDGMYYFDHSHFQNLLGNRTKLLKDENNNSDNELEHGNVINSIVKWNDTIPETNLPASLYLKEMPSFMTQESWPVIGPDIPNGKKIPAQIRYENIKTGLQGAPFHSNESKLDIKNMPGKSGVIIGYELHGEKSGNLSIFHVDSRLVCSYPIKSQSGSIVFRPLKTPHNGIYVVRLSTSEGTTVRKFVFFN